MHSLALTAAVVSGVLTLCAIVIVFIEGVRSNGGQARIPHRTQTAPNRSVRLAAIGLGLGAGAICVATLLLLRAWH